MATTREDDYRALIERIGGQEARSGFSHSAQIRLSDEDLAVVVSHDPEVIGEAMHPVSSFMSGSVNFALGLNDAALRDRMLGELTMTFLRVQACKRVLPDVIQFCYARKVKQQESAESARGTDVSELRSDGAL